jgi:selenocysteine lyase/cysteine desulfurase
MLLSRRSVIAAASAAPLISVAGASAQSTAASVPSLPDRNFCEASDLIYLDSGSQHPVSIGARKVVDTYLAKRELDPASAGYNLPEDEVRAKFAKLINAVSPDEIAFVQSTTAGEQMVLRGLGLPQQGAHIVTDTLHFFGSLPLYEEMARQGCEVTWVKERDGRIPLADMARAIRKDTKLVSLSLVSTINGFEHDLKAVCDLAHANGALVYADIIHAAGAVPVDVQASGVDFAACASYKWLMGDFGLGFIYARKDVQARLKRTEYGYYGMTKFEPHIYPFDPPGDMIADYAFAYSAEGHFAHGTYAHTVVALLGHSLDYIQTLGVPAIQAHAQTLTDHFKEELPRLGYTLMTPKESKTPLVACAYENARDKLAKKLSDAKVRITISKNRFRFSPSVFNDHTDVERALSALGRA